MIRSSVALTFSVLTGLASAAEIQVSPAGPVTSLVQARDALRELRKNGPLTEPVTVTIQDGVYEMTEGLLLEPQDSGSESAPVIFKAAAGAHPKFYGGPKVTGFTPHEGKILKADLKALNLPKTPVRQLLFANQRQPLARFPNAVPADPLYSGWAFLQEIPEGKTEGLKWKSEAFIAEKDIRKWAHPEEVEMNVFAGYGWWNFVMPVASVDPVTRKLTLAKDCGYDLHPYNRYFFQNALEELDAPGEWFIDQKAQTLYFWPPAAIDSSEVRIPVTPNFIKLAAGTKFVTIEGLSFTGSVGTALQMEGTDHCTIARCTLETVGGWSGSGISISGTNNSASDNEISYVGNTGIGLAGGDRITLKPANNIADNNHIHHVGMLQKNGPGVSLIGVGNKVTHNDIHDTPRMAIQFSGNNLVIEYNHLHHTVLETQDGGAVYTGGRDWISSRGTSLKYNFIHDTIGLGQDKEGLSHPHFSWGIYMDDNAGGVDIVGNIVARSARAALHLHNGRDHLIENNIFVDGIEKQIEYSGWSATHPFLKTHLPTMIEGWEKVKDQPAWKGMRGMEMNPKDCVRPDGTVMSGNIADRNIFAWKDASVRYADLKKASPAYNTFDRNLVWAGGKPVRTSSFLAGADTGPELLHTGELLAATEAGKTPKGWGWNSKPRKDLVLAKDAEGVIHIEAATGNDPKAAKVNTRSPSIPVKAGAGYRVRMKVKGSIPEMSAGFSYAMFVNGGGYWQSDTRSFALTDQWQEIEITGSMPREDDPKWKPWMKDFWLRTDLPGDKGELLIKDIQVHETEVMNSWESWQAEGWDKNSLVADPMFENWEKDDYRLKPGSPAFKLGFAAIPVEKIGRLKR